MSQNSLSFDGSTGYATLTNPYQTVGGLGTWNFALSFWIKTNSSNIQGLLDTRGTGSNGIAVYIDASGYMNIYSYTGTSGGTGLTVTSSVVAVNDGNWHEVLITYNGTNASIFVDGVSHANQAFNDYLSGASPTATIGALEGTGGIAYYFSGKMASIAFWNVSLTLGNISSLYAGTSPLSVGSPCDYWAMTAGSGTTVADTGSNAYGLTLHGTVTWSTDLPGPLSPGLVAGTLTATVASSTSITLATTGATGGTPPYTYELESSPDNSTWNNVTALTASTPYTNTGLTTRVKVYYRVLNTDSTTPTPLTAYSNTVLITPGVAATYYIANAGSNSANGTSASTPWQTTGHVNGFSQLPGDVYCWNKGDTFTDATLLGGGGTLTSNYNTTAVSGTQASPITYTSYGTGAKPIIKPSSDVDGCLIQDASYIVVENLDFEGPGFTGTTPNQTTTGTATGLRVFSSQQGSGRMLDIVLTNCSFDGFYNGAIIATRAGGTGWVDASGSPYYFRIGAVATGTVVGIDGVQINNCSINGAAYSGLVFIGGYATCNLVGWPETNTTFKGAYIGNCQIANVYGISQTSGAPNVVAFINCDGLLMERSVIGNCGQAAGAGSSISGPGGVVIGEYTDATVQWCECYGMITYAAYDGTAFDCDIGAVNCTVQHCFSHDNDGSGFICGDSNTGRTSGNVFRYCDSYNDCRSPGTGSAFGALATFGGTGTIFHNCNVYLNAGAVGRNTAYAVWLDSTVATPQLYNCNFFTTGSITQIGGKIAALTAVGNNYYWGSGGQLTATYSTLSAWQAAGYEKLSNGLTYGISADPLWKAEASFGTGVHAAVLPSAQVATLTDFDLQAASPCIGAGVDLFLLGLNPGPIDFHGYPYRTGPTVDIGACAFYVTPPNPPGAGKGGLMLTGAGG